MIFHITFPNQEQFTITMREIGNARMVQLRNDGVRDPEEYHNKTPVLFDWALEQGWATLSPMCHPPVPEKAYYRTTWSQKKCVCTCL